jgi:hypothetical protein
VQLIDTEAPYPDGCGPDCKGCDPCVCGHPWSDHLAGAACENCSCATFDSRFKVKVFYPTDTLAQTPNL